MLTKPIVVVSKCLGFEACRYNGQIQNDEFINKLKEYVDFITVCPEVAIGLQTPRESIRIISMNEEPKLIQTKTGKDLSKDMEKFTLRFLDNLAEVDGFILKTRSPSCGIKDVKIYSGIDKGAVSYKKGKGVFGSEVVRRYFNLAVEDEGRLKDFKIREHFLTKLYMMFRFREMKSLQSIEALKKFHEYNSLLLMCYNSRQFKNLESIIRSAEVKMGKVNLKDYENHLALALNRAPRYTSNINMLMKIIKSFDDKISDKEKDFILDVLQKYRNGNIPFIVPLYLVKGYLIRFNDKLFLNQSFFQPYPNELIEMRDSGKILT